MFSGQLLERYSKPCCPALQYCHCTCLFLMSLLEQINDDDDDDDEITGIGGRKVPKETWEKWLDLKGKGEERGTSSFYWSIANAIKMRLTKLTFWCRCSPANRNASAVLRDTQLLWSRAEPSRSRIVNTGVSLWAMCSQVLFLSTRTKTRRQKN